MRVGEGFEGKEVPNRDATPVFVEERADVFDVFWETGPAKERATPKVTGTLRFLTTPTCLS